MFRKKDCLFMGREKEYYNKISSNDFMQAAESIKTFNRVTQYISMHLTTCWTMGASSTSGLVTLMA